MATNKDRMEALEREIRGIQDGMQRMETRMADKLQRLKEMVNRIFDVVMSNHSIGASSKIKLDYSYSQPQVGKATSRDTADKEKPWFMSNLTKLEFPQFSRDDIAEWFTRVK
ncbi:hypothetical protein PTKIN_Ptkin04bG0067700 [Pterospermum kingtungense]